jgi:hypothetical protein
MLIWWMVGLPVIMCHPSLIIMFLPTNIRFVFFQALNITDWLYFTYFIVISRTHSLNQGGSLEINLQPSSRKDVTMVGILM